MSYGFPKEEKNKMGKLKKNGLVHFRVHYCLPNDIVNLVFVNNFEWNPVSVNVNNLKPYTYVD